jgi:transposase-like protein
MAYVPIDASQKAAAVKRYWRTNNLQRTAREFRVSRSTLYEWIRLAEANLEVAFQASKPGRRTATPEEERDTLRVQLRDVLDVYHKSSQAGPGPLPEAVARCPQCGRTPLVRNGRVDTKRHGLRQRLWCRDCRRSVYVEVKKTL